MERSIGCKMAELEPIRGYNCTKTAISQKRLLRKKLFTNPYGTPPRPFNVFEQTLHYQLVNPQWKLKIEPDF